jgi:hypothetical protein
MSKIASLLILLVAVLVCWLPVAPAQAQAARTFVSAAGSDSNNCTNVATPCRHFAAAYAKTVADGEIDVLDPANYGALTISQGISIQGHGWASVSGVPGGASITINGGDKINISGVILDGGGVFPTTGIYADSVSSLNIRDSVIRNFTQAGINYGANSSNPSQLYVSNTLVSDNGADGIAIGSGRSGTTNCVLDHVQLENNALRGLELGAGGTLNVTVTDSVLASNKAPAIYAIADTGTTLSVMVRNSTIANNFAGFDAENAGVTISVTRSTITGNSFGWFAFTGGAVLSYGDNNIDGNTNFNTEPPNPLTYK